ncbi:uncharacterized protein TNIN_244131 [Trichonephila inaurata madagascariensis]|uniref:Transposase n=1 Tax=Trichonephila inaurata madagascariensis TaxID=2747483 RepID=A0A8X6MGS8_9ARAC|nr:uncharacterized protein TNIN_244131 [Trichonephila inaurata madagascariensis]
MESSTRSSYHPDKQWMQFLMWKSVLMRLRERIVCVRPAIANHWRLHLNNAPSHTAFRVVEYLAQRNVSTLPHPPCSPDLAPPDIFLFPRIKLTFKGSITDR